MFTATDLSAMTNVTVIGPTILTDLFGDTAVATDAIGQTIRIGALNFQIIGVTKAKGASGMNNQDDAIYISLTTAQKKLYGVKYVSTILIGRSDRSVGDDASDEPSRLYTLGASQYQRYNQSRFHDQ
jgi:putative ABC transport system permease protein